MPVSETNSTNALADSKLCDVCDCFDVRALLKEISLSRQPGVDIVPGLPTFYALRSNLLELKSSAKTCDLCSAIWSGYARLVRPVELEDESLSKGVGSEQIYLGSTDWNTKRQPFPCLVATQHGPPPHRIGRQLACFEPCAAYGSVPAEYRHLLGRLQARSSDDALCSRLAFEWMKTCQEKHAACQQAFKTVFPRPTRLLEITARSTANGNIIVRLVDGVRTAGCYTALSYCWGGKQPLLLTCDTEESLRSGKPIEDFPRTLRDAIVVTRDLGAAYIWIDALCIQQDSSEDWAREAGRMRDVYRGAWITIEAASAGTAEEGFLHRRANSMPYCKVSWRHLGQAQTYIYLRPVYDIPDSELLSCTIYSRGWTLQERMLAPRTLAFGRQQMTFDCITGFEDETGHGRPGLSVSRDWHLTKSLINSIRHDNHYSTSPWMGWLGRLLPLEFSLAGFRFTTVGSVQTPAGEQITHYDFWREIVTRFTSRSFTQNSDRLAALSGLAQEFHRVVGDTYVAGMWSKELPYSLAWDVGRLVNPETEDGALVLSSSNRLLNYPAEMCPEKRAAPSWSWASARGLITFPFKSDMVHTIRPLARIIKIDVIPEHDDPFGTIRSGVLDIQGPFLEISSPIEGSTPLPETPWKRWRYAWPKDTDTPYLNWFLISVEIMENAFSASEFSQHHIAHPGQRFGLLKLFVDGRWTRLLFLESCGDGTWRRLSLVSLPKYETGIDYVKDQSGDRSLFDWTDRTGYNDMIKQHAVEIDNYIGRARELELPRWAVRTIRLV